MNNINDIDEIISSLSNLSIERVQIMPSDTKNIPLLRYQADNIPLFDGNPKLLNRFLNSCENLIHNFKNNADPNDPINVCLFDTVLSKLRDRAADLISSRSDLNTWTKVKEVLQLCFADQRSIDCLIQDLISLKPHKNESPIQFGMRIQDVRSLLFAKLCTITDQAEKDLKIAHYNDFALKTYINGLPYNLQLIIRLKQPDSVEKAMAFVTEEENFIYFSTGRNQNLLNETYKPQNRVNPLYQPPSNNQNRPNNTPLTPIMPHIPGVLPRLGPMNFNRPIFPPFVNNFRPPQMNNFASKYPSNVFAQHRSPLLHNFPYRPPIFNQFQPPRPNFQNMPQNRFTIIPPNYNNFNRNSAMVRTQNKQYTPEPMDTTSVQSPIKPKQNFHINTFEENNPKDNSDLYPQNSNNSSTSQANPEDNNSAEYNNYYTLGDHNYEYADNTYCYDNDLLYHPDSDTYDIQGDLNYNSENFQQTTTSNTIT